MRATGTWDGIDAMCRGGYYPPAESGLERSGRLIAAPTEWKRGTTMSETYPTLHQWERGPKIVAIGGGTGLSTMLRGLKK